MSSYLDKIKKAREDMQGRQQEEHSRKEETGFHSGSVVIADSLPEKMEIWKPETGEHVFDIIPWLAGKKHPYEQEDKLCWVLCLWIYQNVGAMRDQFVSPSIMWRKPDPVAEYMASRRLPEDEYKKRKAKHRAFYLVWVHDTPEEEKKGVQLWEIAHWFIVNQLKEASEIPMEGGVIPYMDPEEGSQIFIKSYADGSFTDGEGKKRDSIKYTNPKFVERKSPIPDSILEQGCSIDNLIDTDPSYEVIYKSFYGADHDGERKVLTPAGAKPGAPDKKEKTGDDTAGEKKKEKMSAVTNKPAVQVGEKECPHGFTFGADHDKFPTEGCDGCIKWDPCSDELDVLKAAEGEAPPVVQEEAAQLEKKEPAPTTTRRRIRKRAPLK